MRHPPLASDHIDAPHLSAALGDLRLESGESIRDYRQSYVVHGALDPQRSNAVLVCASLTGNHHRLDFLIGPGKALDTTRFCVIATDPIGNGLSTSPSNSPHQPGTAFPRFRIRDMVQAQYRLLTEELGLAGVHAVVGASMGGMQALQWGVSHPDFVKACVAMTPMAKTAPWAVMVTEAARSCLQADPAWTGSRFDGVPVRGWRAYTALMTALLSRTPTALAGMLTGCEDAHAWFERLVGRNRELGFDATDYLYQSWAYEMHDVGTTPGFAGTGDALASLRARTLILAPGLDLFNPGDTAREAAAAIPGAEFVEIPSHEGHQAATSQRAQDADFLNTTIRRFL
ncbi:MAG: alpha/beta fold hydrolase [Burkholderiales bacterium]